MAEAHQGGARQRVRVQSAGGPEGANQVDPAPNPESTDKWSPNSSTFGTDGQLF